MAAPKQTFINFIDLYGDDPVGFVRDVLKAEPQPWQEDFLRAVARGERRISVRAHMRTGRQHAQIHAAPVLAPARPPARKPHVVRPRRRRGSKRHTDIEEHL